MLVITSASDSGGGKAGCSGLMSLPMLILALLTRLPEECRTGRCIARLVLVQSGCTAKQLDVLQAFQNQRRAFDALLFAFGGRKVVPQFLSVYHFNELKQYA